MFLLKIWRTMASIDRSTSATRYINKA